MRKENIMEEKELMDLIAEFNAVILGQLDGFNDEHVWLRGVKGMLSSRVMLNTVLEDINIFHKYVKNKHILDFGTGSGYLAYLLASKGYIVAGIDIDDFVKQETIETHGTMTNDQKGIWPILEEKLPNLKLTHYKTVIPYNDHSFDGIVAYAVLEHIQDDDIPDVMKEMRRVLKPNGHLFISMLPRKFAYIEHVARVLGIGHHDRLYGDIEIINLLEEHGFEILENSFAQMFPAYPAKLMNTFFPILKYIDRILLRTPLRYFAHDYRIMCKKLPGDTKIPLHR